jgi:CRP/FNR family transcriptional regulator, cyclic AMP receptor protein
MSAYASKKTGKIALLKAEHNDLSVSAIWQLGQRQPKILERLTESERIAVVGKSQRRKLVAGEPLFLQGDAHRGTYIIEKGLIRTYYTSPSGREVTLAYWLPGNLVGTPDLFGETPHMWSGSAETETEVIFISGVAMRTLIRTIPSLAVNITEVLIFKCRWLSAIVQMLGTHHVGDRLAYILLALCDLYGRRRGQEVLIDIGFTHDDLATMVCASRQWVTMTLLRFQQEKAIRVDKRRISVRPNALRALLRAQAG